jgi:class 3 adenylate cyclase
MPAETVSLADLAANPNVLSGEELCRIQRILDDRPGLFLGTGQPGTGKTTTLLVMAYLLEQRGIPITLLIDDEHWLEQVHLAIPATWTVQYVPPQRSAWQAEIAPHGQHPSTAIVTSALLAEDYTHALLEAAAAGCWVLICLDTPFVGPDVLYNLRGLGLTPDRILAHLVGITSQVLLSRLCEDCKRRQTASLEDTQRIYPGSQEPQTFWYEQGCPACGEEGTRGRCAAYEVLQVNDAVRPLLSRLMAQATIAPLPPEQHFTLRESAKGLMARGLLGVDTYRREVLLNPLLRFQHYWQQESDRADRIQDMFGRFVTQQLIARLMSQQEFQQVVEGERRAIACLFCDVRGFTRRAERSSPVALFATLNRYFRDIIAIVFDHEGMIDKFIGDSVMVIFGTPIEQPDRELRAVRCAIAIQQKVADINARSETEPLQVGIGINSGEVIAGCLGSDQRMDYTVIGDVVNVAARLESQALPGQILIGPTTYGAVAETIPCRTVGALTLKGKAAALEAYEVLYAPGAEASKPEAGDPG